MSGRTAAKFLVACILVAFVADVALSTWSAELVCGIALAVGLCCLPDRSGD